MAFKLYSDVRETSTTGGTGNQVLAGALDGSYSAFISRYADGDTLFYCMKLGTQREIGKATYNAGANSLTRSQVYKSTNGNALVNFGAGTVDIFVTNIAPQDLDAAGTALHLAALGAASLAGSNVLSGNLTVGSPSGSVSAPSTSNTNILLYNLSATNWAGVGVSTLGDMYFKVGLSGSPAAAMSINATDYSVSIAAGAASTSTTTGALKVNGGIGVAGNVTVGGYVNLSNSSVTASFFNTGATIGIATNSGLTAGQYMTPGGSTWTSLSDARLPYKKTARKVSVLDRLEFVQIYENDVNGRTELFVKAQEFNRAFPHLVKEGGGDGNYAPKGMDDPMAWGVMYERAGVAALQGVKELQAVVQALSDDLQSRIAA